MPLTPKDEELCAGIAMFVSEHVKAAVAPLCDELEHLKTRLAELEKRGVEYCGVWQRAASYRRGMMSTHDNSLWACIEDSGPNECPGVSNKWQLAVKTPERRLPTNHSGRPR